MRAAIVCWFALSSSPSSVSAASCLQAPSGLVGWWSADGREIYYLTSELKLMAVEISAKGTDLAVGAAHPLLGVKTGGQNFVGLDFSHDGKRVLAAVPQEDSSAPITLVTNWTAGLKR